MDAHARFVRPCSYISFQHVGIIYDVTRDDGRPFNGKLLDIKYHAMDS